MYQGYQLPSLAKELDRQNKAKQDFIVDSRELSLIETADDPLALRMGGAEPRLFGVKDQAHAQLAGRLEVPKKYYDRMRHQAPGLLRSNVNHWLQSEPKRRLVRVLDGNVRALLSDRYRRMDNFDLVNTILPILQEEAPDLRVASCNVSDDSLYLKVVFPSIQRDVTPGDGVQAGLVISNSETGRGKFKLSRMVYRLICKNGMVVEQAMSRAHLGARLEVDDLGEPMEMFSNETLKADDNAFWHKVGDVVRASARDTQFDKTVELLRATITGEKISNPVKAIEALGNTFGLGQDEQAGVLAHLIEGADLSQYGMIQAVTAHAQASGIGYDRATDLEAMGGKVLALSTPQWGEIAQA